MGLHTDVLAEVHDVVLHNWPSRDVPDTLVRAGFAVTVYGGPEPDDISAHELAGDELIIRKTGTPPARADVVYVFPWPGFEVERDLPAVASRARELGAATLWYQSGRTSDGTPNPEACWLPSGEAALINSIVKHAGLRPVYDAYIADSARQLLRALPAENAEQPTTRPRASGGDAAE